MRIIPKPPLTWWDLVGLFSTSQLTDEEFQIYWLAAKDLKDAPQSQFWWK